MRKIFISGILFSLIFLLTAPYSFGAVQLSQRWVCLNAVRCDFAGAGCSNGDSHKVKLTVKQDVKPLSNAQTYIVECLATTNGQVCSAGNANQTVYGGGNTAALANIGYQFQGMFQTDGTTTVTNPVQSNNAGVIGPYEWRSYTPGNISRKFLALNYFDPSRTQIGNVGGQQQGTFDFDAASKNCVSINWDPYGRVFDSQTLEPIPNAQVTLLKKQGTSFVIMQTSDVMGGDLINPQTTKEDGGFSFVVPDNIYKLSILRTEYTFPNAVVKLNPNYTRVYSDIYRGEEINQQGRIQHRDVPLDHTGAGKTYPLVTNFFYETNRLGTGIIDGQTSHPFAMIKAYSVKIDPATAGQAEPRRTRHKLLQTLRADKNGKFNLEIDQSNFEPTEIFGELEVQKTDLTQYTSSSKISDKIVSYAQKILSLLQVHAQESTTIKFDPIPAYLEGYSYGPNGQVQSRMDVGVYVNFSNNPYYQTQSDENGYFKISSEFLPNMPYKLKYTSPSVTASNVSTSKFVAQNAKFIASNKIQINTYKDETGKSKAPVPTGSSSSSMDPTIGADRGQNTALTNIPRQNVNNPATNSTQSSSSSILLVIVIILVLLGVTVALLGFYMFQKNKTSSSQY